MLKIYNTLSKKIEAFESIEPNIVRMYVCGPTVYGDIHIGNARPVIFFDCLKRYLIHLGYDVIYASNITDVDDKIIQKAFESNLSEADIAKKYEKAFFDVTSKVGSNPPDIIPKATYYIPQMIDYIQTLVQKKHAYVKPSGIYFRVNSVQDYGMLSHQNIQALEESVRIENHDDKEDVKDFVLWKKTDTGVQFNSPWGEGRPGWHTECAVMNHHVFGQMIDIHGGGSDLKFPHHENEIAQCQAHDHHSLSKYWMHVGRLDLDNQKMSKSLGNTILVKDLIQSVHPMAFRLLILGHHYRQQIKYQEVTMQEYSKFYDKIKRVMMKTALEINQGAYVLEESIFAHFIEYMNDDFNTPNVMSVLQDALKQLAKASTHDEKGRIYYTILKILAILGIQLEYEITDDIKKIYRDWLDAREQKNYSRADELRKTLMEQGWLQ